MTLQNWLHNSWLVQHTASVEEISNLLAISDRDLAACQVRELPTDWRFAIAYNAALQAATAGLAAAGYRASRDNHHYRVIQSLEFTIAPGRKFIDTLDSFARSATSAATIFPVPYPTRKPTRWPTWRRPCAGTYMSGS
jgi:hypothetical protein